MGFYLPCLGKRTKDSEREPLLPKNRQSQTQQPNASSSASVAGPDSETPVIDKIVDVLAALRAEKLPTQDQISRFLRFLLRSDLLKEDQGRTVSGGGPTSKQGRRVLADLRNLVQISLRFGMEKNADNTLQELYFQLTQMDSSPIEVNVNVDTPTAYKAGQAALNATKAAVSELKEETLTKEEVVFDGETLIDALRTLFLTSITSPAFRLIVIDLFFIARDQVAHAAADVGRVAHEVKQAANDVEQNVRNADDIIVARDGEPKLDVSVIDDVKQTGKETVDKMKTIAGDVKKEWEGVGQGVTDKTKEKVLERIQESLSRVQGHPASRSAMRAIILLARKYAEKITSASEVVTSTIEDAIGQTSDTLNAAGNTYPPQPYRQPQKDQKPFIDITSDAVLQDLKVVLQRMANGHSLDGILAAFSSVVRDIEEVPLLIGDKINNSIDEKLAESTSDLTSPPSLPSLKTETTPAAEEEPQESKSKKKKKKKAKKKQQKASDDNQSPSPVLISPSRSQSSAIESPTVIERPSVEEEEEEEEQTIDNSNPLQLYFSRLGGYLDKSLGEDSDWLASDDGWKTLEGLFDDGVELVNVIGESVIEVGEELVAIKEEPTRDPREQIRRRFKNDLMLLMDEVEDYITSLESDKTTVELFQAFGVLGDDLSALMNQSPNGQRFVQSFSGMRGWTTWIGWAIPRLLRLMPTAAIPIPFIEVKTPTMEGALQALFIQGLTRGTTDPLGTSLVPDEVVLREWTEMRIDMADRTHDPLGGFIAPSISPESQPGVHTTSRLRMHMDGVRARVDDMGYYFKYKGGIVEYEDEGVLSVNVGMDGVHEGLGLDVEVEVENDFLALEAPSRYRAVASAAADIVGTEVPALEIIVQSEEGQVLQHTMMDNDGLEVQISTEIDPDEPANMDVQAAVAPSGSAIGRERDAVAAAATRNNAPAAPLFHVADVSVAMRGLRFKIDKSRHWILNKFLVQPLAGPLVTRLVKQALEEKVRGGLEVLAHGLGEVARDARRRGEGRRATAAVSSGRESRKGKETQRPRAGSRRVVLEDKMVMQKDGLAELLGDWWNAILHAGPAVFGRAALGEHTDEAEEGLDVDVQTRNTVEASSKGLVFTSTTTTATNLEAEPTTVEEQPSGTHPATYSDSVERIDLASEDEEVVVTIGSGEPRLFPGKAGASTCGEPGVDSDEGPGLVQGIKENMGKAVDKGAGIVERVGERWDERMKEETRKEAWKSTAFEF